MIVDIYNIKKTLSKLLDMEEYNFTPKETDYLTQAAGYDLMKVSEMRAAIILMGVEIEKLRSLNINLEQALDSEVKKNEKSN